MSDPLARLTAALADRYRLERELGQGGMATVYLAQDLKHDRKVAVKVLRPELAAVLGADRFVQEIKTTAALQHPHILPLFDSGTAGGFLYYVMPYIEGETLRSKLDRETQLGIEEAVRITREVADALDYAHRHGVIHRDIKPENILLHDGRPMVADFGIALALSAAAGGRMTETGMSLGTPHYMSPEQATADKEISARSDIYSLGSVCYEMLAGEPPHMGNSAQQIIMKIVAEQAQPVTRLRKNVPPNVAAAVGRALEKLPADRFASAAEFAAALADRGFTVATMAAAGGSAGAGGRQRIVQLAGWAVAAVELSEATWGWPPPRTAEPSPRPMMALPQDQPLKALRGARFALSPDGRLLAYAGGDDQRLLLRRRDQLAATVLEGTATASNPTFSPDGTRLAFVVNNGIGGIRVVGLGGAPPTVALGSRIGSDGLTWATDGNLYYDGLTQGGTTGIMRISPEGGTPVQVTTVDTAAGEGDHYWPQSLPEGRGVLFTIEPRRGQGARQVAVLDLATGQWHTLLDAATARYAASGHLVYVTEGGDLLAVPFSLKRLAITGDPIALTNRVATRGFGAVDLALSASGTLVYTLGAQAAGLSDLVYVSRTGAVEPVDTTWQAPFVSLALSPDGRRLAYRAAEGDELAVWVRTLPSGPATKLSFGGTQVGRPAWTPDGRTVGFISNQGGVREFLAGPADGSVPVRPLVQRAGRGINQATWSQDGTWLLWTEEGEDGVVFARRTAGDTATLALRVGTVPVSSIALSPDNRFLAYNADEAAVSKTFVRPFPAVATGLWNIDPEGAFEPHWSHTGRELLYYSADGRMISIEVLPGPTFIMGKRQALFDGNRYVPGVGSWAITPDDQRFLVIRVGTDAGGSAELVVVENFVQELRSRRGP